MTDQLPDIAAKNAPLLRALRAASATSPTELANLAGTQANNVHRTLDRLREAGMIEAAEGAGFGGRLTADGARALLALEIYDGTASAARVAIDPALIDPNPFQPRIVTDEAADLEMIDSVRDKGILQPIRVRRVGERYEQAFGHRRVRAALAVGCPVPAEIHDLSDDDMLDEAGIENLQRGQLHWMDEADYYLALASRGRSAAQVRRLVGEGGRSKRGIQEMTQFARELDADAKRRARLPEGDPQRLSYDQCRAMVGNKRARPALDLTPKHACALLELLFAGDCVMGEVGDKIEAVLHARPTGGPLITLSDRGLVRFKFAGGDPVAVIEITAEVAKYLDEVGYDADPLEAVNVARAAVIGELAAGALAADARYLTAELNPPDRSETTGQRADAPSAAAGELTRGDDLDDGQPLAAAAAAVQVAPAVVVGDEAAMTLMEMAHKIAREAGPGDALPSAEVDPSYRLDPLANQLVYDRLIMFRVQGAATAAALTPTAQAWLDWRGVQRDAAGLAVIDDSALTYAQAADGRALRGDYITPWLTLQEKPAAAPAPAEGEPQPAPSQAGTDPAPKPHDEFMRNVFDATREPEPPAPQDPAGQVPAPLDTATVRRLAAAARQGRDALDAGLSRKLKPEEIRTVLALMDAALGDIDAALARVAP